MILLLLFVVALFTSLLTGGHIERLGQVKFKYGGLVLGAMAIQLFIYSGWWQEVVARPVWTQILYLFSLLLLLAAFWFNRRVPGLPSLGAGLLLNALVIAANGGRMPASMQALRDAGIVDSPAAFQSMRVTNSALIDSNTPLWFLGDILAIPERIPLANVFSIGDICIALGGIWFVWAGTRAPRRDVQSDGVSE